MIYLRHSHPRRATRPLDWLRLGLLVLVVVLLPACDRSSPPDPSTAGQPASEKSIIVAYAVDIRDVNELTASATELHSALHNWFLFSQLLEEQDDFHKGPPTFKPALAEAWEFSDDRRQLTFHLREGLQWSDGVPITAEDVRWTWEAQIHPDVAWSLSSSKDTISDVEVLDARTVRFHFTEVYATQLLDAVFGVILPKHAWSELPFAEWRGNARWFFDHLVVSGPYDLDEWIPGQRFVLRRNPHYFEDGFPRTERIVFQVVPDSSTQMSMLRSGQVHMTDNIHPSEAAEIVADPDLDLHAFYARQFNFICWNLQRPLFAEKEIRQALTLAIDRQELIDSIYYGYAVIGTSPFPSGIWAHDESLEPWPYDPGRAREILAEQGWIDRDGDGWVDRDGQPFRFELLTNAANRIRLDMQVMIKEQLKRVGVDVRPRGAEFNTELALEIAHDFDACLGGASMDTSLDMSYFFHSDQANGGYNFSAYSNPEVDALLDEISGLVDQFPAKNLFDRLQQHLHEDLPFTYLYENQKLVATSKRLRHVDPNSQSVFFNIRKWELAGE